MWDEARKNDPGGITCRYSRDPGTLPGLRDSEAHFSVIISEEDLKIFKRLGVRVSCEPKYETKRLYHR